MSVKDAEVSFEERFQDLLWSLTDVDMQIQRLRRSDEPTVWERVQLWYHSLRRGWLLAQLLTLLEERERVPGDLRRFI